MLESSSQRISGDPRGPQGTGPTRKWVKHLAKSTINGGVFVGKTKEKVGKSRFLVVRIDWKIG